MYAFVEQPLLDAIELIQDAQSVVVLSGAGLSKASGIPTYRDVAGLWRESENLKYAHTSSYNADPEAFLSFWKKSVQKVLEARPNPAHFALQKLQHHKSLTTLVTQNVDGLLSAAGCKDVVELHGSLRRSHCDNCGLTANRVLERCLRCGSKVRPAVVLFGEMLDVNLLGAAQFATASSDLLIVVGTTAEVYPAASIPFIAQQNRKKMLVIDTEDTALSCSADVVIKGQAEYVLPRLVNLCC